MRHGWLFSSLASALALLGAGAGAACAEEKKMDIFNLRLDLGVWSIVVFLGLYFVLKRYAWGPILQGLQKREETIREAAEKAEQARADTERARADFERKLAEANAEIPKLREEARRKAQDLADEMRSRAQADIQAERQRLRREIDAARDQALHDLQTHAAQLATLISAKVLRRELSAEDHRRLVDEALGELRQADRQRGPGERGA